MNYFQLFKENSIFNNDLNSDIKNKESDNKLVNEENAKYLTYSNSQLRFANNVLFGIYLFLLCILAYILYNKNMPYKAKIIILLILLLYPFYISALQDNLRFLYNFLFSGSTNINETVARDNITEISNSHKYGTSGSIYYDGLTKENSVIDTKTNNIKKDSSTNDRNSVLTSVETENYKYLNTGLFYIYYICVVGFLYVLFATSNFPFNIYLKIVIIILLAGYPYYINMVANYLIYLITMIYSTIMARTYKDPNNKYDTWNENV
jgi:hypothetical protein